MRSKNVKCKIITCIFMSSMMLSTTSAFAAGNPFPKPHDGFNSGFHQSMMLNTYAQHEDFNNKNPQNLIVQNNDTQVNNSQIDNTQTQTAQYCNAQDSVTTSIATLVSSGILTSDQESAINNAFTQQNVTTGQAAFFGPQDGFILPMLPQPNVTTDQGAMLPIPTQNVATNQAAFFGPQDGFILPMLPQPNVTTNQATTFIPQNKQETISEILSKLVAAGTITSDQEVAIETALKKSN